MSFNLFVILITGGKHSSNSKKFLNCSLVCHILSIRDPNKFDNASALPISFLEIGFMLILSIIWIDPTGCGKGQQSIEVQITAQGLFVLSKYLALQTSESWSIASM